MEMVEDLTVLCSCSHVAQPEKSPWSAVNLLFSYHNSISPILQHAFVKVFLWTAFSLLLCSLTLQQQRGSARQISIRLYMILL